MLQFETVEKSRERGTLYVIRDLLMGAWLGVCAILMWPFTLLGLFFWALEEISVRRLPRPR